MVSLLRASRWPAFACRRRFAPNRCVELYRADRCSRRIAGKLKATQFVDFQRGTAAREDYDAVCVLGGGYAANGSLPPWVHRRLDTAYALFQQQPSTCYLLCVGGGTPHRQPLLDTDGHVLHESTLIASYLMQAGVDPERLLKESASYDTVGNAYFTLTSHAIPAQWQKLAIVTSRFHMPRTQALYTDIFNLASTTLMLNFELDFFAALDDGAVSAEALEARESREVASLETWKRNMARLKTLQDLHKWLHKTHQCYAVSRQHEFAISDLDSGSMKSY